METFCHRIKVTMKFPIHVCIIRFFCFRANLWLNFDLKAAAEPAGLLQGRPCDPTHCLQNPLSHLLHDNTITDITTAYVLPHLEL